VVEAVRESGLAARTARQCGPALVFGRLWDRQGLPELLRKLAHDRKFEFDLERAAFAMALQRLYTPGSDLAGSEWIKTVEAPGFEGLALQHCYRTAGFLAGVRQDMEGRLFYRDLNLFNQTLEEVFIDTTSKNPPWKCGPSTTSGTTPPWGTSCPVFWPCAWKWTCNNAWMSARSRSPGPT
jgi:hypothetical protein